MKLLGTKTIIISSLTLIASSSFASSTPLWVGDPDNGNKLYQKHCAACHGEDATGGRTAVSLIDSGRMNILRDDLFYALIQKGQGAKDPAAHSFNKKLSQLETWDVVATINQKYMALGDFFPEASRYLSGEYTIDKYGLKRIYKATGKKLKDKTGQVFTFFDMPEEVGTLTYVPPEPILLDELKKKYKSGYLVFLPFEAEGFEGEIGVAMDASGVITRLAVMNTDKKTAKLNKKLATFAGKGKKGTREPFKSRKHKKLAKKVFSTYLRAMETATMYDRDENERTWADE